MIGRAVAVAVALAVPGSALAAGGTRSLHDPAFTTAVPAGWHERSPHTGSRRSYFFNSGSGHANALGLPGRGQIGLTIGVKHIARRISARHALLTNVGYPRGAKNLHGSPIHGARLAGARAATITLTYRYKGVRWVQRDLVAVHSTTFAFVEVDAGPSKARAARRTLATVTQQWRWR